MSLMIQWVNMRLGLSLTCRAGRGAHCGWEIGSFRAGPPLPSRHPLTIDIARDQSDHVSRPGKSDWVRKTTRKAREWRLREWARKWEHGDHALQSELRKVLTGPPPAKDEAISTGQPNVVFVSGPVEDTPFPPRSVTRWWRTPTLFAIGKLKPSNRPPREINELTMWIAVGAWRVVRHAQHSTYVPRICTLGARAFLLGNSLGDSAEAPRMHRVFW
ncbi:hypothetical protein BC826DRAFT_974478 [Russula brevipes]|nr:hypothetical protein BC826DRAFT_974478 [Russula brevipes]